MAWDFETEPAFQKELDWIDALVREEVEPLDHVLGNPYDIHNPRNQKLVRPLQAEVKKRKLWACHLGPELGGPGYGQLKLALMNEILGRSRFAPTVFGCQAPDTGNAEILAHYGTSEQKKKYLEPLLNNDIVSCFSMTEPHAGADPKMFKCRATLDGDFWVINGEKWFSSNARFASRIFLSRLSRRLSSSGNRSPRCPTPYFLSSSVSASCALAKSSETSCSSRRSASPIRP